MVDKQMIKNITDKVMNPFVRILLNILEIVQALLLILKWIHIIDWSYALVFLPLYVFLGIFVLCCMVSFIIAVVQIVKENCKE